MQATGAARGAPGQATQPTRSPTAEARSSARSPQMTARAGLGGARATRGAPCPARSAGPRRLALPGRPGAGYPLPMSRSGVLPGEYQCATCGEASTLFVDLSGGMRQVLVEDCEVCCRPNEIHVRVSRKRGTVEAVAYFAG